MITREKLEELRKLVEASDERFDFGGLPLPDIWDTLEALWRVASAARQLSNHFVVLPSVSPIEWWAMPLQELHAALEALEDK